MNEWVNWDNVSAYPLTKNARVAVKFRDGTESFAEGATVADYHGAGGDESQWSPIGDESDIVAYRVVQ